SCRTGSSPARVTRADRPNPGGAAMTIARKKPVAIEARQWPGGPAAATPIIDWILDGGHTATWDQAHAVTRTDGTREEIPERICILTLEGTMSASPGDWIIRGIKG